MPRGVYKRTPEMLESYSQSRQSPEFRRKMAEVWTPEKRALESIRQSELHRGEGRALDDRGYVFLTGQQGHPLCYEGGTLFEHRKVLYDKIGSGPHPCYWCGKMLEWGGQSGIHADHLNGIKEDNDPENLVPSCLRCNKNRALLGDPLDWRPDYAL